MPDLPVDPARRSMVTAAALAATGLALSGGVAAQVRPPVRAPIRGGLITTPLTFDARFMGTSIGVADVPAGLSVSWVRSHDAAPLWRDMNPSRGVYQDAGMRAWITAMQLTGANIMVTLYSTPTWASARPDEGQDAYGTPGGKAEPADPQYLVDFMYWFLSTYGDDIHAFEIWNEPKYTYMGTPTSIVWASYFSGTPEALVRNIAKPVRDTVKTLKPHIKVCGPACTGVTFGGTGSGMDYTNRFLMASDGAGKLGKDYIDVLTLHTYVHDGHNTLTEVNDVKALLATLKSSNGIVDMPVWATEYGFIDPPFPSYPGTMTQQAEWIVNYAIRNRVAGIDVNIGYSGLAWRNDPVFVAAYNNWCRVLQGATMTACLPVTGTFDLQCVINNVLYLVSGPPVV